MQTIFRLHGYIIPQKTSQFNSSVNNNGVWSNKVRTRGKPEPHPPKSQQGEVRVHHTMFHSFNPQPQVFCYFVVQYPPYPLRFLLPPETRPFSQTPPGLESQKIFLRIYIFLIQCGPLAHSNSQLPPFLVVFDI